MTYLEWQNLRKERDQEGIKLLKVKGIRMMQQFLKYFKLGAVAFIPQNQLKANSQIHNDVSL